MIVVSDTSPINYLVLIGLQDLLLTLFDRILIPEAVRRELQAEATPEPVRQFIAAPPNWVEMRSAPEIPPTLAHLDSGEREALALALTVRANFVLIDERKGRQAADDHGVRCGLLPPNAADGTDCRLPAAVGTGDEVVDVAT